MHLFDLSRKEKTEIKGLAYEGLAIAAGEYGMAIKEAEVLLPKKASMKLMAIL